MEEKRCPECNNSMYFNSYFSKYVCPYDGFMSEKIDRFKGNEVLLDSFINLLIDYIDHRECYPDIKIEIKMLFLKLLNSL
jgi:hypothetical protein